MTDGDEKLSPEQDKAIGRIVVTGALIFVAVEVAIRILDENNALDFWKLLAIGLAVSGVAVVVAGLLVARVEQKSWSDVMRRTNRQVIADLKATPARVRQRLHETFRRDRTR